MRAWRRRQRVLDASARRHSDELRLKVNSALQELNLDNNKISNSGATALAEAPKVNTALHELLAGLLESKA